MGIFLDSITILGMMAWLIKLAAGGVISIELAGGAMVAMVAFVAIARAIGSGLVNLAFRVALPIAGLAVLIAWESGGNARAMQELATAIAALFIMLLGFYIMFRSVFRRRK